MKVFTKQAQARFILTDQKRNWLIYLINQEQILLKNQKSTKLPFNDEKSKNKVQNMRIKITFSAKNNPNYSIQKLQSKFQMLEKGNIKVFHYRTSSRCYYTHLPYIRSRPTSKNSKNSNRNQLSYTKSSTNSKLEMTNIKLFFQKYQLQLPDCPSILSLIKTKTAIEAKNITLAQLESNQFPVLEYCLKDLIEFSVMILKTSQFCRLRIPTKILRKMVTLFAESYNQVAYHNFSHAFSLMMLNYQCFVKQFSLKYLYTQQEYFCILVAGLAHDINHSGTNNSFEVKMKSKLALSFNNQSVLQNMHITLLWKILQNNPDYDFLLHTQNPNKAKSIITRLILSTDMSLHNKNLDKLQALKKDNKFDPKHDSEHKWLLMQQIFHACDIGNSCSQYQNYINWTSLLCTQFNQLTKKQEANGLEVTKFLAFKVSTQLYEDQIWFVDSIVVPLWKQIIDSCPELGYLQTKISKNIKKVKEELKKIKQDSKLTKR